MMNARFRKYQPVTSNMEPFTAG